MARQGNIPTYSITRATCADLQGAHGAVVVVYLCDVTLRVGDYDRHHVEVPLALVLYAEPDRRGREDVVR